MTSSLSLGNYSNQNNTYSLKPEKKVYRKLSDSSAVSADVFCYQNIPNEKKLIKIKKKLKI